MFDKENYWKLRSIGSRGQGDAAVTVKHVGDSKRGEHMVRVRGLIQFLSRTEFRRSQKIRAASKKGFKGHIRKPANYKLKLPMFPPDLTNNARSRIRTEYKKVVRQQGENAPTKAEFLQSIV